MTAPPSRRTMSLAEAAKILGVSRTTMWRAASEGTLEFPVIRIRGTYRISCVVLDRYLRGERFSPTPGSDLPPADWLPSSSP